MRISDWSSDVCSSDLCTQSKAEYRLCLLVGFRLKSGSIRSKRQDHSRIGLHKACSRTESCRLPLALPVHCLQRKQSLRAIPEFREVGRQSNQRPQKPKVPESDNWAGAGETLKETMRYQLFAVGRAFPIPHPQTYQKGLLPE